MLKITIETDNATRVIDLSAEEQKAFEFVANGPLEWIVNAIGNRVACAVDKIVIEASDRNPRKTQVAEKLVIVKNADVLSSKERQVEFEAKE